VGTGAVSGSGTSAVAAGLAVPDPGRLERRVRTFRDGYLLAMKLLERLHLRSDDGRESDRLPAEAPRPQPEHGEKRLADPTPTELSREDYLAILKRSVKETNKDNLPSIAAALAYYAFLAIPSTLMMAVGIFGLVGDASDTRSLVNRLDGILPGDAQSLLSDSLTRLTHDKGTGVTVLVVGIVLALWSLSGAMQNVMWGLNVAYERDETRGFVRRRGTALMMVVFTAVAVLLVFGLLVLGPHLTRWIGEAAGQETLVTWVWWAAEWPLLISGLLVAFAGIYYLGPNVDHPRWQFITFGAVIGALLWLAFSGLFAFYVSRFGSYNKTWGSLSAVVVMLVWLWLSGLALLFGAEVNAEAERSRELRRGESAEVDLQAPAKA
jgi:membrane protein